MVFGDFVDVGKIVEGEENGWVVGQGEFSLDSFESWLCGIVFFGVLEKFDDRSVSFELCKIGLIFLEFYVLQYLVVCVEDVLEQFLGVDWLGYLNGVCVGNWSEFCVVACEILVCESFKVSEKCY